MTSRCDACGEDIIWADLYNGGRRPFNAAPRDPNPEGIYPAERWYPIRGQGMTPSAMLGERQTEDRQYLTQHTCRLPGPPAPVGSAPEIALLQNVIRTPDLQLDSRHEYTYRWPSSWAHVLSSHQHQALCGDRMPEGRRTNSRERARLRTMPVCPSCIERLDIPTASRARQLIKASRDEARANAVALDDPTDLGLYVRSRHGSVLAPVHRATCPTLTGITMTEVDWVGWDVVPQGSVICDVCKPPRSLDEPMSYNQHDMARAVEQERARRARTRDLFRPLGPYVYMTDVVHRNDCGTLLKYTDTKGWRGTSSIDGMRPCAKCEPDLFPVDDQ